MDDLRSGENWFTMWRKIKPDLYQYYTKMRPQWAKE